MKRDKAHGDASPSIVTEGEIVAYTGVEKRPRVVVQLLHHAAFASALGSIRVFALPDWTPY